MEIIAEGDRQAKISPDLNTAPIGAVIVSRHDDGDGSRDEEWGSVTLATALFCSHA